MLRRPYLPGLLAGLVFLLVGVQYWDEIGAILGCLAILIGAILVLAVAVEHLWNT